MIVKLTPETSYLVPHIVDIYRAELPKILLHQQPEDVIQTFIQQRDNRYFRPMIDQTVTTHRRIPARKSLLVSMTEDEQLNGVLESARYPWDGSLPNFADIVWVLTTEKGKGIGTALCRRFIDDLEREPTPPAAVYSYTTEENVPSQKMHDRVGFKQHPSSPEEPGKLTYVYYPRGEETLRQTPSFKKI